MAKSFFMMGRAVTDFMKHIRKATPPISWPGAPANVGAARYYPNLGARVVASGSGSRWFRAQDFMQRKGSWEFGRRVTRADRFPYPWTARDSFRPGAFVPSRAVGAAALAAIPAYVGVVGAAGEYQRAKYSNYYGADPGSSAGATAMQLGGAAILGAVGLRGLYQGFRPRKQVGVPANLAGPKSLTRPNWVPGPTRVPGSPVKAAPSQPFYANPFDPSSSLIGTPVYKPRPLTAGQGLTAGSVAPRQMVGSLPKYATAKNTPPISRRVKSLGVAAARRTAKTLGTPFMLGAGLGATGAIMQAPNRRRDARGEVIYVDEARAMREQLAQSASNVTFNAHYNRQRSTLR